MSVILARHETSARESPSAASIIRGHEAEEYSDSISTAAVLGASMSSTSASTRRRAHWETTKRVLAQAVNEGMAIGIMETSATSSLCLHAPNPEALAGYDGAYIQVGIRVDAYVEMDGRRVIGFLRAEDLLKPVLIQSTTGEASQELDPGVLCRIICSWQPELAERGGGEKLINEVQNATENQGKFSAATDIGPRLKLS
jgi:hypothetical protein